MKFIFPAFLSILFLSSCLNQPTDYASYVDPFIGTAYTGHTYPAATTPFGMVQVGPDSGISDWEFCSGYHDSSSSIMGFSHTHLSGTGCPDMGDIMLMPMVDCDFWTAGEDEDTSKGYRSRFNTLSEKASPGYYSVLLEDYGIKAEMTATPRVGFHRYTFPESGSAAILIDLEHGIGDTLSGSWIKIQDDHTVTGMRRSRGFVSDHWYYFKAEFSKPFLKAEYPSSGTNRKVKLLYRTKEDEPILVKVSLSTVSEQGALENMSAELPGWDFEGTMEKTRGLWNQYLSRMEIEDDFPDKLTSAYTSLYHALLMPNLITDVSGAYTGWDHQTHQAESGKQMYTNFSLWDTYRAEHPLLNILYPEINTLLVNSLLEKHRQTGLLVTNEYGICETWCMIGNHAVPVIVDAYLKGLPVDASLAWDAVRTAQTLPHNKSDWDSWDKYGYYPYDIIATESVSRSLEHCYDDYCAYVMAKKASLNDDAAFFRKRANYYKNLFDQETLLMRPKDAFGRWLEPFDPFFIAHESMAGGAYTEGNAWQYTWHVQHDAKGLIRLFGSNENFLRQLDYVFESTEDIHNEKNVVDVTGLIGQYAHGNEPSHHVAYLYTLAGRPDKTAEIVREVFDRFYLAKRDGLCGNDDCGQMSCWYLFSGMGFYPVDPISGEYVFGAPQFKKTVLHLPGGKDFTINAQGLSQSAKYVSGITLNGSCIPYEALSWDDLRKGGELTFQMSQDSH